MKPLPRPQCAFFLFLFLLTITPACVWWDSISVGSRESAEAPRVSRLWTRQLSRKTRWRLSLPYLYPLRGELSIPLVTDEEVFVGTSAGEAVSLELTGGGTVWKQEISADPITCRPAKIGGIVAFAGLAGEAVGLDVETGEERWRTNLGAPVQGAIATFTDRFLIEDAYGGLHALFAESGELAWRIDGVTPRGLISRAFNGAVVDEAIGAVYWGRWDGTITAADAAGGAIRWRENYAGTPPERFTSTDQGLFVSGEFLYAARYAGPVFKIRTSDGIAVWKTEEIQSAGGPAASARRVLVPQTEGALAGLDGGVGGKLLGWGKEIDPDWGVVAQPVEVAPEIFAAATSGASMWSPLSNGRVFLVQASSGELLWESELLEGSYAGLHGRGGYFATLSDRSVIQLWRMGDADADSGAEELLGVE